MKNEPKSLKSVKEAFDAKRFDQVFPKFDAKKENAHVRKSSELKSGIVTKRYYG